MKNLLALTLILSLSLTSISCTTANAARISYSAGWVQIGEKTVDLYGDHDELYLSHKGTFTRIKFKVLKAPIYVRNVKITYGNGQSENYRINQKFHIGQESKILDLPGGHREIHKITINYDTINVGKGRAVVIAYGKK